LAPDLDGNDSLLADFTALVCHEINNSLNGLILQVAVIEQAAAHGTPAEISKIGHLAREAADLVRKLQTHVRDKPLDRTAVDINDLARSARDELQERYPEAHIKLDLADGRCSVHADASALKRILSLLGWHSVSVASAAKPQIIITTRVHGTRCILTWHDNGPAVADPDLGRLFEPFQSTREGSDNVSLPVVSLLARRLYGSIKAARAPEGGMNFILELSLASSLR
jgi:C4-dicarboxylate-specific signal transduction histidine kinase